MPKERATACQKKRATQEKNKVKMEKNTWVTEYFLKSFKRVSIWVRLLHSKKVWSRICFLLETPTKKWKNYNYFKARNFHDMKFSGLKFEICKIKIPPEILFQPNREIKMLQNIVSELNRKIKVPQKRPLKFMNEKKMWQECILFVFLNYEYFFRSKLFVSWTKEKADLLTSNNPNGETPEKIIATRRGDTVFNTFVNQQCVWKLMCI